MTLASEFKSAFNAHIGIVNKMGKEKRVIIAKAKAKSHLPLSAPWFCPTVKATSGHYGKHRNMVPYTKFEHLLL